MNWGDFITPSRIRCAVEAANKQEAISLVCELIASDIGVDTAKIQEVIRAREKLGATTIGKGILLPHAQSDAIAEVVAAMLVLKTPLDCSAPDDVPVDIVIGILTSRQTKGVPLIAKLVHHLRSEVALDRIRSGRTPQEVWSSLRNST